jgi:hypothetical protein
MDWKSAYQCLHNSAETAMQSIVAVGIYILIALCLTFGGATNPSPWSDVSKLATDLANDLVQDDGWDPNVHFSLHQHLLKDSVKFEDPAVPIAQVSELAIHTSQLMTPPSLTVTLTTSLPPSWRLTSSKDPEWCLLSCTFLDDPLHPMNHWIEMTFCLSRSFSQRLHPRSNKESSAGSSTLTNY